MCGIIGIVGRGEAPDLLLEGLKRLEYRGYDSAGIATLVNGNIERRRAEGKLENLEALLDDDPIGGTIGIGHTRWATHGRPNETNAHPHATNRAAIVHNGIIENFQPLRAELEGMDHEFFTDTDSEVVAHLLTRYLDEGMAPVDATRAMLGRLEGAFALAIIFAGEHELMIGARRGSPLAVGFGEGEMYLGSDSLALAPLTQKICYLDEGDWAEITPGGVTIHDESGKIAERPVRLTANTGAATGKGDFPHFMLKEIFEQPGVIGDTLYSLVNPQTRTIELPDMPFEWAEIPKVTLVACGTSSYAALVAKYWFEE
ncbi:MAG: glutamine--fructose-6-phosphate aminotransferase, partial [Alphaproteobacteria bacterium]|nr:glutamine--fructose-6-phosphate aminotransferase [Alphaproteobacteria bacterium]